MKRLELRLMGPFQALADGVALTGFRSDKARALLAYLAVHGGRPQSRETLADLLWGESAERDARTSLRQSLTNLKRLLNPERPLLDIDWHTVTLHTDEDGVWVDTAVFVALRQTCEAHAHTALGQCGDCLARLAEAASLYRGDFLVGLAFTDAPAFDEWRLWQQEQWYQQTLAVLYNLTNVYAETGQYRLMEQYARQQLTLAPWREEAHRQLMQALVGNGHRSEALAQYENCRRLLATELGVEPTAEMVALVEKIKQRDSRAIPVRRHNLPPDPTPFLGRQSEMAQLQKRLRDPAYRLVTIMGEGGMGKTRLALATAATLVDAFADGVWFVPLAGLAAPLPDADNASRNDYLSIVVLAAVGVTPHDRATPTAQLFDYLRDKRLLLLLDNFEHLLAATSFVLELWRQAPQVTILVTSRIRLNSQAEYVLRLAGLPTPETADDPQAAAYDSIQLFAERADRTPTGFELDGHTLPGVVQLCRLVQGIPLAIELAAAWIEEMTLATMATAIQENIAWLHTTMVDVPPRHRSMYAVFAYSWELLTAEEQAVLSGCTVCRGGFTAVAAQVVADADATILQRLVDKSLLQAEEDGRLDMHPLLAQFVTEIQPPLPTAHAAHSQYYLTLLADRGGQLYGSLLPATLTQIRAEFGNIERAWHWASQHPDPTQMTWLLTALPTLVRFCAITSRAQMGGQLMATAVTHLEPLLATTPTAVAWQLMAHLQAAHTQFLTRLGQYDDAIQTAQQAIQLAHTHQLPEVEAFACLWWAQALFYQGDYANVDSILSRTVTLAQNHQLSRVEAFGLRLMGARLWMLGKSRPAARYYTQALEMSRALSERELENSLLTGLGNIAMNLGEWGQAKQYYQQALALGQEVDDRLSQGIAHNNLGVAAMFAGDYSESLRHLAQAEVICKDIGNQRGAGLALSNLGQSYRYLGAFTLAQEYLEKALALYTTLGEKRGVCHTQLYWGVLAYHQGDLAASQQHSQQALVLAETLADRPIMAHALKNLGDMWREKGVWEKATAVYEQAIDLFAELEATSNRLEAMAGLTAMALAQHNIPLAYNLARQILPDLPGASNGGLDDLIQIYRACYQAMQAMGDPAATELLSSANTILQNRAALITDQTLRQSYLTQIASHRWLTAVMGDM